MGYIVEEIPHPIIRDVSVSIDERVKGEMKDDWEIISLEMRPDIIRTPEEMVLLGEWLISTGNDIKSRYTSKGKLKKVKK